MLGAVLVAGRSTFKADVTGGFVYRDYDDFLVSRAVVDVIRLRTCQDELSSDRTRRRAAVEGKNRRNINMLVQRVPT